MTKNGISVNAIMEKSSIGQVNEIIAAHAKAMVSRIKKRKTMKNVNGRSKKHNFGINIAAFFSSVMNVLVKDINNG